MEKGLVLFVEGDTDEEIFHKITTFLRSKTKHNRFQYREFNISNLKGIGNYKQKPIGICSRLIDKYNGEIDLTVVLSYDTDVFTLEKKPPINWKQLDKDLRKTGVKKIYHIKADKSIEDWLMSDVAGLLKSLRLAKCTNIKGNSGYDKIVNLFKKGNRIYTKGTKISKLVDTLDIEKITCENCSEIKTLCKLLDVECEIIKDLELAE